VNGRLIRECQHPNTRNITSLIDPERTLLKPGDVLDRDDKRVLMLCIVPPSSMKEMRDPEFTHQGPDIIGLDQAIDRLQEVINTHRFSDVSLGAGLQSCINLF
jgi:hypothetical protein